MADMVDMNGEEVAVPPSDSGSWILTFQEVGCKGCKQQLPAFARFLRKSNIPRDRVVSVVLGDRKGTEAYESELGGLGRLLPAGPSVGAFARALDVSMFPTYLIVDGDGTVAFATHSSSELASAGGRLLTSIAAVR
ncbi:hypothetical protein [Streptomyces sp. CC219B]|uniref:hypothetical protein n=1 Tax=Streptomyces sp. CC219B TaxID=3044574 RepID=UPI0024A87597|nr:hypothetical protein [Streptomyces sp. CC219B]